MLQRVSRVQDCRVIATDGEIGRVEDVYFDDARWVVRYLVVNTGSWLSGREVLISPYAVKFIDPDARAVVLNLTRERVRRSPPVECDRPVSRQKEIEQYRYYGYPPYWPYPTFWAGGMTPVLPPPRVESSLSEQHEAAEVREASGDSHLRSSSEVTGYRVHTIDGNQGHLEDVLFDDQTWAMECLIIDTRNWLPGRLVLLSPEAIRNVDWAQGAITVARTSDELKEAPEFDAAHLRAGQYDAIGSRSAHRP